MSDADAAYADDEPVTIGFAVALSGVRVATWWLLWLGTVALGVYRRRSRTQGWTLYKIILAAVTLACLRFTVYLAYADAFNRGHDELAMRAFSVYIFFANLSSSFFLVSVQIPRHPGAAAAARPRSSASRRACLYDALSAAGVQPRANSGEGGGGWE